MPDAKVLFGRRLRLIRKSQGVTLERLGQAASIGYKHIADIERGEKTPSFDAIDKLAKALNVPVHDLFVDVAEVSATPSLGSLARDIEANCSLPVRRLATNFLMQVRDLEQAAPKKTQR